MTVAPTREDQEPALQLVHKAEARGDQVPGEQTIQAVTEVAATDAEKEPALQLVHPVAAS